LSCARDGSTACGSSVNGKCDPSERVDVLERSASNIIVPTASVCEAPAMAPADALALLEAEDEGVEEAGMRMDADE
jgi:hypothetical protein